MKSSFHIHSLDHLVLVVKDVATTCTFYQKTLGLQPIEHPPGKWALHFGNQKISLQPVGSVPKIAAGTTPGSGNFCLLTDTPLSQVEAHLRICGVSLVAGPLRRVGAQGPLWSLYFHDPDGNLVEVANQLAT